MYLNALVFIICPYWCLLFAHYMPLSISPKGCSGTKCQCKKKGPSIDIDVAALAILYHAHLYVNVFFYDFYDNSHTDGTDDGYQAEK